MEKPKRIMAACDDSPQAAYVAAYAASLAYIMAPRLILARVIPQCNAEAVRQAFAHFQDVPKDPDKAASDYIREEKKDSHEKLSRLLSRRHRRLKIETVVRVGVPHEVLLDLVAEKQIDIVVVGASKNHILLDRIFGSTVSHLFRRCPVPLVSTRQPGAFARAHQVETGMQGVYVLNHPEASFLMDRTFTSFHRYCDACDNE